MRTLALNQPSVSTGVGCRVLPRLLAVLLFGGFVAFSVTVKNELLKTKSPLEALKIGETMPDFTLTGATGAEVTLRKVSTGKQVVLINFWATWCGPCRMEMPGFEKLYHERSAKGFLLLAVSEDEKPEDLDEYLKKKQFSFPILRDGDHALSKRFGLRAFPTTVLVGSDGKILQVIEGGDHGGVVLCAAADKNALLVRLIVAGANVGTVRRGRSLEDLYMQYAGGASSG